MKLNLWVIAGIIVFILGISSVNAGEFLETPNANYVGQTYNRATGFFYKPNVNVTLISITKSSLEAGTVFNVYNNGTTLYFTNSTWDGDVLQVGIILNASTVYAFMVRPSVCGNRDNAHDSGLSGTYPQTENLGNITGAVISDNACNVPEIYIDGDGYSLESWNVTSAGEDVTSPVISNIIQVPENITSLNVMSIQIIINATITDETALNLSSIYLNSSNFNGSIYINGTLIQNTGLLNNYTVNDGNNFEFRIDEGKFLSASYNIEPELIESYPHLNYSLSGLNSFVKIQLFNLSNNKEQVFFESMDFNTSAIFTLDYYYCNEDYVSGNPVSHNNCTLFAQRNSNTGFNHSHGNGISWHRVIPIGLDTSLGTLNGIQYTNVGNFLIRGNIAGVNVGYVNLIAREDASQTSNNNGNSWNDLSGSFDMHVHQFGSNESLAYEICASDNSSNTACSDLQVSPILFFIFPPNAVDIFNPMAGIHNITIVINHSVSGSASGQTITGYKYEYKRDDGEFILITSNNFPNTIFNWDISNLLNSENYILKITVTDNLNLTTATISETFIISNPLSVTDQLLTENNNLLQELIDGGVSSVKLLIYFILIIFGLCLLTFAKDLSKIFGLVIMSMTMLFLTGWLLDIPMFESAGEMGLMGYAFSIMGALGMFVAVMWLGYSMLEKTGLVENAEENHSKYDVYQKFWGNN